MEGITILSEYAEVATTYDAMPAIVTAVVVFLAVTLIIMILSLICENIRILSLIIWVAIFSFISYGTLKDTRTHEVPTGRTIQQVIISGEVDINDFFDKYDLLDKNGRVYTIVERDKAIE